MTDLELAQLRAALALVSEARGVLAGGGNTLYYLATLAKRLQDDCTAEVIREEVRRKFVEGRNAA